MLGISAPPELDEDKGDHPPRGRTAFRLISMGFFVPENQAVIWRGPMLHKALEQFITDVKWGEPDYLIIDMPPGTGDVSISMSQFLPPRRGDRGHDPAGRRAVVGPACRRHVREGGARPHRRHREHELVPAGDDGKAYEIFGFGRWPGAGRPPRGTAARSGATGHRAPGGRRHGRTDRRHRARLRGRGRLPTGSRAQIEEIQPRKIFKKELRLM